MVKEQPRDPGAHIGHEPELAADRVPGGIRKDDDRVAANSSQYGSLRYIEVTEDGSSPPAG